MTLVALVVVGVAAVLAVCLWSRQGHRLAVSYTAETGEVANSWSPTTWALVWTLSPLIGGAIFDRATGGYASDNSAFYRRLARFRPGWLVRTFIMVVGTVVGLVSLPVSVASFAKGQVVPGLVALAVAVVFLGAAGTMLRMRPRP